MMEPKNMKRIFWIALLTLSFLSIDAPHLSAGIYTSFIGNYRKATVPIRAELAADGKIVPIDTGTGFLVRYEDKNGAYEFLITAKHVLANANQIRVFYNRMRLPGDHPDRSIIHEAVYPLEQGARRYWSMATDPNIDIAVIILNSWKTPVERSKAEEQAQKDYGKENSQAVMTSNSDIQIEETGVSIEDIDLLSQDQLQDVILLGYPMGLISKYEAVPIVRSGTIALASLRGVGDYPAGAFLVAGSVYPGNSGGPVILRRTQIGDGGARIDTKLIGVVSAYIPYNDIAISQQTKRPRIAFEENTGLGIVYPSQFIIEAINNYLKN